MSKYKWWLHKKEINKIVDNIDRIANEILGPPDEPRMIELRLNDQNLCLAYSMEHISGYGGGAILHWTGVLNAGDIVSLQTGAYTYAEGEIPRSGIYSIQAQAAGERGMLSAVRIDGENHLQSIERYTWSGHESRVA